MKHRTATASSKRRVALALPGAAGGAGARKVIESELNRFAAALRAAGTLSADIEPFGHFQQILRLRVAASAKRNA